MKSKESRKINSILNRIEKDIKLNKRLNENLEKLQELLKSQPYFSFRIKNDIAEISILKGELKKALQLSKNLYEVDRKYESARKYFELLMKIGEFNEAKNCALGLSNLEEREYLLGNFYRKVGNIDEALKHYKNLRFTIMEDNANLEYAYIYRSLKQYDKAKEYLNKLLTTKHRDTAYRELIYINLETGNYNILNFIKKLDIDNCDRIKTLQKSKRIICYYNYLNGNFTKESLNDKSEYYERQLVDYSKEETISHIKKRHTGYKNIFKINGDLDKIYDYCRNNLNNLIMSDVSDTYLVAFPYDIGIAEEYKTNLMKVITVPHTNKILTFYPVSNPINYVMQKSDKIK